MTTFRSEVALALCLLLSACSSLRAPSAAPAPVATPAPPGLAAPLPTPANEPAARFQAQGHLPDWTLRLEGETIHFQAADGLRFSATSLFLPDASAGAATLGLEVQGHPILLNGERRLCRDTTNQLPYPWQISVTYRGQVYLGCGGQAASLLTGAAWQVDALDGAADFAPGASQLRFEAEGLLSGQGPCNRLQGRYQIGPDGLSLSALRATERACADPALQTQEQALLRFLPLVARHELDERGDLLLRSADGRQLRLSRLR
jgi:heat shock protein HslJ